MIMNKLAEAAYVKKEDILPPELEEFYNLFSKEEFDELPPHQTWDHATDLIPDAQMKHSKVYPLSLN